MVFRSPVIECSGKLLRNGRVVSFVLHPESLMHGIPRAKPLTCLSKQFFRQKNRLPARFIWQGKRKSPLSDYNDGGSGQRRTAIRSLSDRRSMASALVPRIVVSA